MVRGCKISINIASDDIAALGDGSKIKLELQGYEKPDSEAKDYVHKYATVFDKDLATTNEFGWKFKLDAQQVKDDGDKVNKGDVDINYGQRWILDGDRERLTSDVVDDPKAPKHGFKVDNAFDGVELSLNFMSWQGVEMFLGKYNKGNCDVVPKIPFRVTVTSGGNIDTHDFLFDPKDPKDPNDSESRYTQTITYHPAKWSSG